MGAMSKKQFVVLLVVGILFAQDANGVSVGMARATNGSGTLSPGNGVIEFKNQVPNEAQAAFEGFCQVSEAGRSAGADSCSAAAEELFNAWPSSIEGEPIGRETVPIFWTATALAAPSEEHLARDMIGVGEHTVLLWSTSCGRTVMRQWQMVGQQHIQTDEFAYAEVGASVVGVAGLDLRLGF
jgi:hypothetical protein